MTYRDGVAQLAFVHTDHLGTPKLMTDIEGAVVWRADAEAFGKTREVTDAGYENPLRFPGQYADVESGYFYNYYRDYDPELGRYLESDPIGLAGGVNTFGYVGGRPIFAIDPQGLEGWSNYQAWDHYMNGGGAVTLSESGMQNLIQNSSVTQGVMSRFGDQIGARAFGLATSRGMGTSSFSQGFSNSYEFVGDKFWVGSATLSGDFNGSLTVESSGQYSFEGEAKIQFFDNYHDPYDLTNSFDASYDNGTPYDVTGSWSKKYSGSGDLGYCPK